MIEGGGIARFAQEPLTGRLTLRGLGHDLEGDLTMKDSVMTEVDRAHATAAKQTFDSIVPEAVARGQHAVADVSHAESSQFAVRLTPALSRGALVPQIFHKMIRAPSAPN